MKWDPLNDLLESDPKVLCLKCVLDINADLFILKLVCGRSLCYRLTYIQYIQVKGFNMSPPALKFSN